MKIFKKMKKGFTLVELVVVIAVIAILAAVSVGAYFGVTESANRSKLEQEGKQVQTAIQTISLAGNEHSSLTSNGLEISNPGNFRLALEESLGKEVALTDELDTKDSTKPTIYFTDVEIQSALGDRTYKTFEYHLPEISGKKAQVNVVTGEVKVVETSAAGEELPEVLPTVTTISEALTAPENSPVEISGTVTVTETFDNTHSNITFTITDGSKSIEVYRGTFDSQLIRGDIVSVKGTIVTYQGTNQVKQGSIVTKIGHDASYDEVNYITSFAEALASEDDTYVKLTGTVISIDTPYNETYKNISVTIADEQGNKISAYRTNGNAELLDIVEITGVMDTFNSKRQIAEDSTLINLETKHTCTSYLDADCVNPEKCVVCGTEKDGSTALNHIDNTGEGNCDRCGYNIKTETIVFVIKDYATTNSWSNAAQYKTISINEYITAEVNGGSNTGKYYSSNHSWRLYETENAKLEIAGNNGTTINSIKIEYDNSYSGKFVEINSGEAVDINSNLAVFTVAILGGEKGSTVQITSITISYVPSENPSNPDNPEVDEPEHNHDWSLCDGKCVTCGTTCEHTGETEGTNCSVCGYSIPNSQPEVTTKEYTIKHTKTTTTNMTGNNDASSFFGMNENEITIKSVKDKSSNHIGCAADGNMRIYSEGTNGTGNGGELHISVTNKTISKIVITFGSTVGSFTVNGIEGSKETTEYTINASTVIIKNTTSGAKTQVHIAKIIVYAA